MSTSDEDHNYYSQSHRRSQLPDYNIDINQPAAAANDALPLLPALYYRQSQQYPKRPTISTNFDNYSANANLHAPSSDRPATNVSPDPHEFYRPYRESFRRESGSVYGELDFSAAHSEEGMASTRTSQRPTQLSSRVNGYGPSAAPRRPPRAEDRTSSSPLSEKSATSSRSVAPGVANPRGRQSSLQALVNKFNQTHDEVPPLPSNPNSRSTSANPSPSSAHASKSFKARASSETLKSRQALASKSQAQSRDGAQQPSASDKRRQNQSSTAASERSPRRSRKPPTIASNAFATQSMTDLSHKLPQPQRKPLFGEVTSNGQPDLGYGIPGSKIRRGSEGSVYHANSVFHDDTALGTRKVSPSSPTAWYMGVTPSLEGIDFGKPLPAKRPDMHRRSRSDIVAGPFAMPPSKALSKTIPIMSPPLEQHSSDSSPTRPKRNSQSRIPVSNRRRSNTSESGNSLPSRPPSTLGYHTPQRKTPSKTHSHLPTPIETKTPDRSARYSTARKSPRRYDPSPPRQSSPRLQAFISEAPPAKSPPLRSSRPRQPVSTATTSASRARAAANPAQSHPRKNSKPLPELGGVDLATRRERIQRAFTTKVKEKEIETERRRMSLLHDAQWQQGVSNDSLETPESMAVPMTAPASKASFENLPGREQQLFSVKSPEQLDGVSDLNAGVAVRNDIAFDPAQEDSPTLGTAQFLEAVRYDGSEPSSAQTSGTVETFLERDLQQTKHKEAVDRTATTITEQDAGAGAYMEKDNLRQSRPGTNQYGIDGEDTASIQIMLQDPQDSHAENRRDSEQSGESPQGTLNSTDNRWSTSSWGSSAVDAARRRKDSPTLQRINENDSNHTAMQSAHESLSTNASSYQQSSWSPESLSTKGTARDSDPYNTINNVLEDYHGSTFMNSENINEFQQRLFAQSPALARQGNYDPQKVTQLYLQSWAREKPSHSSAVPPPLEPHSRDETESTPKAELSQAESQHASAEERGYRGDDEKELVQDSDDITTGRLKAPEPFSHRASASLSNADDWLNTSPSMLDWMAHQQLDTPVEEKSEKSAFDRKQAEQLSQTEKGFPALPGIQPSGGLGIDITVQSPHEGPGIRSTHAHPDIASRRGSPMRPDNIARPESPTLRSSTPASTGKYSSAKSGASLASHETPSRKNSDESGQRYQRSRAGTESVQPSADGISMSSSITPAEQKRLNRRKNILKEIVDTESSFGKDMTVVVDIYKGTSNVILDAAEDGKALFGNSADIVQFSMTFLDSLKQAVKSVYVLPRDKRWKTKRDSSATTGSTTTDDQSLSGTDLSDEEKDRMTTIGTAFENNLTQMEKVYTEYLKNHDAANQKLQQLQKSDKVKIWLKECRAYAHDLTTAWDLDSLLVKPVQRILKYPLLLNELLAVTPENHPDFVAIDTAAREMVGVSVRINEAKKRADLVEQVNNSSAQNNKPKKKEKEGRLAFPNAFGRRTEKLKQQVGVSDTVQDKRYDAIADKFGSHFFQLQVVMRDVEMYVIDTQNWVNKFNEAVVAFESYLDVGQTTSPEIESKWRRFRLSMRDIQITALTDHTNAVRKNVIDPMTTLLKLHDGPQKLMDKRKKRVMDYAKYKAIKEKGEKPDKKTIELGEQFIAVNDTLKDELPKLFSLTGKLVEACLQNFVQLQLQWMNIWRAKLRQSIETHEIPPSFESILPDFKSDFVYVDAQIVALGLCNGSLVNEHANLINFHVSPSQSHFGGSTILDDTRRPSMNTEDSRSRTTSNATIDPNRSRGLSIGNNQSPMIPQPDFGRLIDGFGLGGPSTVPYNPSNYAQVQGRRIRASSTASTRTPVSPPEISNWRGQTGAPIISNQNRPSTGPGRSYDSHSITRPSYESGRPSNDRLVPDESARYGRDGGSPSNRQSTVFSSAMPMSDSPRAQSPSNDPQSPSDLNVLFLAASVYEFNIDRARREAGYPYLTYVAGEIFDVIAEKGELWLAKNQDDRTNQVGWIWNKHFAKLAS